MKHEIVHKYTCEGCGAVRTAYAEIEEFGEHTRKGSRLQRVGASAESEAECILLTEEEKQAEMNREKQREEQIQKLAQKCAEDQTFRMLLNIADSSRYLEDRMELLAFDIGIDICSLTYESSCMTNWVLSRCTEAAREWNS